MYYCCVALKRGVHSEEDAVAVDDCYHHMDDMIEELGGELVAWTDWYGILADEMEKGAEAEVAEERERERVNIAIAFEKERVRCEEVKRQEACKQEMMAERAKPTLNITFYIKNEGKGKGGGKGKGEKGGKEKGKGKKGELGLTNWTEVNNLSQLLGQEGKEMASMPGVLGWENETPVETASRAKRWEKSWKGR